MSSYAVKPDDKTKIDLLLDERSGSRVVINRHGGEVIGYRIAGPQGEIPLLYRDSLAQPPEKGWKNHATILFPIVGGIKNKESRLGSRVVRSPGNHGVARNSDFSLVESSSRGAASARYRLAANDYTRGFYPFEFQLDMLYRLEGNVLTTTFEITNPGAEPLYFCFGWHPGFRTPVIPGKGSKESCRLLFPEGSIRKYHNNEHCRLTGETSMIRVGGALPRTEKELEATLMYEIDDPSLRTVTLEDPAAGISIRVDFPDLPHLGLWSEPGDEFICIEPWQGMDDHEEQEPFDQKVGIVVLPPGGKKAASVKVTPEIKG
ncbi:MAG: hypothetical protein A3F83_15390 [Candidatus Glassbacteria bacterium RIFCSPLOWO2_12_FULL_58_11]|uniref:Aldose epimerase n=1 Tax=Candidatus Glassbacteria bacterium RIFCSPLOWO2_12_FULL_58_11 TaxID=1817867 RepID=A0A1F5Z134_9BACT|nr:MAG: hypothetical protein A3F83_15390 [Candidatus Glassbacteria bacterium RIFCSPLOWO2_12_FULL_58_11]